ncbi:MAG TPA: CPBP family intramembrane glutamic endopeptidase [Actinomycetota bacterium]
MDSRATTPARPVEAPSPPDPRTASPDRSLVVVAWIALFLTPVGIYWRLFTHRTSTPVSVQLAAFGVLVLFVGTAMRVESLRPLRSFLLTVLALGTGLLAVGLIERSPAWTRWAARASSPKVVFADSALKAIPCLLMAGVLVAKGLRRRDMFVAVGDLRASAGLPLTERRVSWAWLGAVGTFVFAGPLAVELAVTTHPDFGMAGKALAALPAAIAFGVFNAAQEEFRFRAGLLAALVPAVGSWQAALMTSALFGFGHWFGHPSGPVGVGMTFLAGFVLAKSMLDTRGSGWAWFMHAVQDVLIFSFLVMAAH